MQLNLLLGNIPPLLRYQVYFRILRSHLGEREFALRSRSRAALYLAALLDETTCRFILLNRLHHSQRKLHFHAKQIGHTFQFHDLKIRFVARI